MITKTTNPTKLRAQQDKSVLLLDCRPKQEFNEGVIKSPLWLNMAHFEVRKNMKLSEMDFKGKFGIEKPGVIVRNYCLLSGRTPRPGCDHGIY